MTTTRPARTFEQVVAEASDAALFAFLRFVWARFTRRPSPPLGYVIEVVRRERLDRALRARSLPRV
jgi:hypothetical protein